MKNLNLVILIIALISLTISCNRDDSYGISEELNPIENVNTDIEGNLHGEVLDENNRGIPNASVEIFGEVILTDKNGYFTYDANTFSELGNLIKVKNEGYFDAFRFAKIKSDKSNYLRVKMVPVSFVTEVSSSEISNITIDNTSAQITIPADAYANVQGEPYNGSVTIKAHYFNPMSSESAATMPGDLRGINQANQKVQLTTYGMFAIELESNSGEELQLRDGSLATLSYPVPDGVTSDDKIPTWHFNEDNGYWIEEGMAQRQGDFMVSEVSHFSFWNCDAPFEVVDLYVRVLTTDGIPVANQPIEIRDDQGLLSATSSSDDDGVVSGKVPKNVFLHLSTMGCQNNDNSVPLGALDEDTRIEELFLDFEDGVILQGRLVDCMGLPLNTAYLIVEYSGGQILIKPDAQAQINVLLQICSQDVSLRVVDLLNGLESESKSFTISDDNLVFEDLAACDAPASGDLVTLHLPSENLTGVFDNAEVIIVDDSYLHVHIGRTLDVEDSEFLSFIVPLDPSIDFKYSRWLDSQLSRNDGTNTGTTLTAFSERDFDIIQNVSEVGDTFICRIYYEFLIDASVQVVVDSKVNAGKLKGHVWHDENGDGIKDQNEEGLPDIEIDIYDEGDDAIFLSYYLNYRSPAFLTTDQNGNFELDGIVLNQEIYLRYYDGDEMLVSPTDQTSEDLDSDFTHESGRLHYLRGLSFSNGEEKFDIGLGIRPK